MERYNRWLAAHSLTPEELRRELMENDHLLKTIVEENEGVDIFNDGVEEDEEASSPRRLKEDEEFAAFLEHSDTVVTPLNVGELKGKAFEKAQEKRRLLARGCTNSRCQITSAPIIKSILCSSSTVQRSVVEDNCCNESCLT